MYLGCLIFITGLCFGSFLNVCIYRIPLKISVAEGRSFCTTCKKKISWYDNIPLFSYFFLGGKCRKCKSKISLRYPFIEFLTAAITIILFYRFGLNSYFLFASVFAYSLIAVSVIDLYHGIIPNSISITGTLFFLICSFFSISLSFSDSITGAITGFSILFSISALYYLLRGKEGMGMGDVKLLTMVGSFTGIKGVLFTVFFSSLSGAILGAIFMAFKKGNMKSKIPFGPFISFASFIYIIYGDYIINWYLKTVL